MQKYTFFSIRKKKMIQLKKKCYFCIVKIGIVRCVFSYVVLTISILLDFSN